MASIKTRVKCDVKALTAKLEQLGERAVRGISTELRTYGKRIQDDAELNAPFETGSLIHAIKVDSSRTGINRRLVVTIFVDLSAPYIKTNTSGDSKPSKKTVGDYAMLMEKGLAPFGSGKYQAREGTISKGPQAGGKFIKRAADANKSELIDRARQIVKRVTQREKLRK